jgi:hypothetical protein
VNRDEVMGIDRFSSPRLATLDRSRLFLGLVLLVLSGFFTTAHEDTYEFWIKTTQTARFAAFGTFNSGSNTAIRGELNMRTLEGETEGYAKLLHRDEDAKDINPDAVIH